MDSLESVQHFVDDYLGYLYELRPTAASFDGVHAFDDHVEDFTRASLDRQARELGGFARRLASIRPDALSLDDRLDRATVEQDVHARLLELERVRSHERSPQFYADTLSTTLASQVVLAYAPAHERGRRLVSKLRQVSPFLNAARQNVKDPPGLFIKTAIETLRGLVAFVERDMPRALWDLDDLFVPGPRRRLDRGGPAPSTPTSPSSRPTPCPRRAARSGSGPRCSSRSCGSTRASTCPSTS